MDPERWQCVKRVFFAALDQPVAERDAFVASASGRDDDLRDAVRDLLARHEATGRFMDDPLTLDTGVGGPPTVDMGAFEFIPRVRRLLDARGVPVPTAPPRSIR